MTSIAREAARDDRAGGEIFGHPPGLFVLFLSEMWERFSYYGMRGLLIFYLTQHFALPDGRATAYYGAYTALVYAFTLLGGFLADRFLGQWRSVIVGGVLILSGHVVLAIEGQLGAPTDATRQVFFLALGLIIAGTGFFKPCVSTLVGALYEDGDGRRQTGFFIFYVGINVGAALAALICGYLGQVWGWSYGFGAAAVGMALGLTFLNLGRRSVEPQAPKASGASGTPIQIAMALGAALLAYVLVQNPPVVGVALALGFGGALLVIGQFVAREAKPVERHHLYAALTLVVGIILFWAFYEQAGSSLNLFAERAVELSLFGIPMTPSQTQVFNPTYIIVFSATFAALWAALAKRGIEPGVGWKFGLGLLQLGLGFYALVIGIKLTGAGDKVGMIWLALAYMLHTTGELCCSPIGLSMMTQLAPKKVSALVMGLWFFGAAAGNYLAGLIAGLTARAEDAGAAVDAVAEAARYSDVFFGVTLFAVGGAVLFFLIARWLDRQVQGA